MWHNTEIHIGQMCRELQGHTHTHTHANTHTSTRIHAHTHAHAHARTHRLEELSNILEIREYTYRRNSNSGEAGQISYSACADCLTWRIREEPLWIIFSCISDVTHIKTSGVFTVCAASAILPSLLDVKRNLYLQLSSEFRKSIDVYFSLALLRDGITIVTLAPMLLTATW